MVNLSDTVNRADLLAYVRAVAPDLIIRTARLPDGRRACGARFTYNGEELIVEAVEGDDGIADPDDAIVRRCAWLIHRRRGLPVTLSQPERVRIERAIVSAAQRGDTAEADRLGLDLATTNEGRRFFAPIRAKWQR